MGTPIFLVKRASNSQDTVDYIVQRAARKNSSGFPGLRTECSAYEQVTLKSIAVQANSAYSIVHTSGVATPEPARARAT